MLTSVIIKKSSPGSPCFTISSLSSKLTGSNASATVKRSHLSKFSEIINTCCYQLFNILWFIDKFQHRALLCVLKFEAFD